MRSYYDILGVKPTSTAAEIRSAYRRIVLDHHPDRSPGAASKTIFLEATEAYETLGDTDRRREYDDRIAIEQKLRDQRQRSSSRRESARPQRPPSAKLAEIKLDVNRMSTLFTRGHYEEAEKLARSVLERDRRQPVPYVVLGDIARIKNKKQEAVRMYANAMQFDPRNPAYRQRYEELTGPPPAVYHPPVAPQHAVRAQGSLAPFLGLGLVLVAGVYVVLSREVAIAPTISLISTWTLGLVVMLFFSGVALGSSLAFDRLIGSISAGPGRMSPAVALGPIALVSFWAAVALYALFGFTRRRWKLSTSRVLASVAAGTSVMALAGESNGSISGMQVFLWGGNVIYLGTLCGWMATEALRAFD